MQGFRIDADILLELIESVHPIHLSCRKSRDNCVVVEENLREVLILFEKS
jgi:hypothetical protein